MDETFFDNATAHDSEAVLAFFADVLISPHEKRQTFTTIDEDTGAETQRVIDPGATVISVVRDNVDVVAPDIVTNTGSKTYTNYPIDIVLPESGTDRIETIQLSMDNIDRTFVDILRRVEYPIVLNVAVGWVLPLRSGGTPLSAGATPLSVEGQCTTFEYRYAGVHLIDVTISPQTIAGQLIIDNILWKKYPNNHETYEPDTFPALWGLRGV